jgi:tRNA (guanine-N7-)-methyltransferase
MNVNHLRRVRSFVRRPGRITKGQQRALEQLLPRYGVDGTDIPIDLAAIFGREASRILDIGFGDGAALLTAAARYPDIDYLGVEVHEPGIGHLLTLIERSGLSNIRVINGDAVDVAEKMLPAQSFDAVNLFFPDPWPKKRHHKRRIVQPQFVAALAEILKPGGLLHFATDWTNYAEHAREVIGRCARFTPIGETGDCDSQLAFRAPTKFERRGRKLGHEVTDILYRRDRQAAL